MSMPDESLGDAVKRRGSIVDTFKAVAWSFFGVRRGADYEHDVRHLNPIHVIAAGVVSAVAFVVGLVFLVQWVVGSGVAR